MAALQNTALANLVTVTPALSLSMVLPVQASLGSFTTSGTPTITVSAGTLDGTPPAIAGLGLRQLDELQ